MGTHCHSLSSFSLFPNLLPSVALSSRLSESGKLGERIWPGWALIKDGARGVCTEHVHGAAVGLLLLSDVATWLICELLQKRKGRSWAN